MSVVLKFASLSWVAGVAVQAQSNVATYDLSEFQCFDDPKTITFENIDRAVDILPTVRMFMCGYSSQCALNMVAYLFMKERLGMNLTFFPTDDYDSVWHAEYWQDWVDPVAYPKFYFEWLYNDSMDLNFEFWPMQLVKPGFDGRTDYVLAEADAAVYPELEGLPRVDYGGFQGTYGEISIYVECRCVVGDCTATATATATPSHSVHPNPIRSVGRSPNTGPMTTRPTSSPLCTTPTRRSTTPC